MHNIIHGQTRSGKTSLCKELARKYKAQGIGVIVLDPVMDGDWECDFKTDNWDLFLEVYWKSESCMAFFDEAYKYCFHKNEPAVETATMGRHRGHINHYIAHRANLIDTTIRAQCSELFLFRSGAKDCKLLNEEWNDPLIQEAPDFPNGTFLHIRRGEPGNISRLF